MAFSLLLDIAVADVGEMHRTVDHMLEVLGEGPRVQAHPFLGQIPAITVSPLGYFP